jgi:hypothetical protein
MDVIGLRQTELRVVVGLVGDANIRSSVTIDLTIPKFNDC